MKTIIAQTPEDAKRLQKENPNDLIATPSNIYWDPDFLKEMKKKGATVVDTTKLKTGTVIFDGEVL